MKRLILGLSVLLAVLCSTAFAEQPLAKQDGNIDLSQAEVSPSLTPEIWLYLQEQRRYDDPKQAVRRKAEARAQQRRDRLSALKWFGMSNARPTASAVPWMGTYSPYWGGNSWDPFQWIGGGYPTTASRIEYFGLYRF
jgi:hypothetical protein